MIGVGVELFSRAESILTGWVKNYLTLLLSITYWLKPFSSSPLMLGKEDIILPPSVIFLAIAAAPALSAVSSNILPFSILWHSRHAALKISAPEAPAAGV